MDYRGIKKPGFRKFHVQFVQTVGTCQDSFAVGTSQLDTLGDSGLHDWMEIGLPFGDGGMSSFIFLSEMGWGSVQNPYSLVQKCKMKEMHAK